MALFFPIHGDLSGKLGGNVYARNKGGAYVRQWVRPTNPKTGAQMAVRAAFGGSASAWSQLSEDLKSAWNQYAINYFKPRVLKARSTYSGFQAFVSLRNAALQAQRLKRTAEIDMGAAMLTMADYVPVSIPPSGIFQGNLQTSDDIPLSQSLYNANLEASTGEMQVSINLSARTGPTAPKWIDPSTLSNFGYIVFASARNNSSQLYQQCVGSIGPITMDGAVDDAAAFVVQFTHNDLVTANRKLWYSTGDKIKMSVFSLSSCGESALVGQVPVTVT